MEYGRTRNYEERNFSIPYVCSYSPMLRLVVQTIGAKIAHHIESIIEEVHNSPGISESLKQKVPGGKYLRQVDIRPTKDDPTVLLKCFVGWDEDKYIIFVEGAGETYWEKTHEPNPVSLN